MTRAVLLAALGGLIAGLVGCAAGNGDPGSPTMAKIRDRGRLVCAVDGAVPGFSTVGPGGAFVGIDADFCRAVAAAVLWDPTKVEFRPVTAGERFVALGSGEVDLLTISSTHTLSRDAPGGNALSFGPVFFYDGQGVMVPAASGVRSLRQLVGKPICVESGTNTELNLADRMRELGVAYQPLRFQSGEQAYPAYEQGRCAAITSDSYLLAAKRSGFKQPAAHVLLPISSARSPAPR